MNPIDPPLPRSPMAQYKHSQLPPEEANPNQLAQQLGGVDLADNSSNPHGPQIYLPMNENLTPGTYHIQQQQPGYNSKGYPTTPGCTPEMSGLIPSPQPALPLGRIPSPKQIPDAIKVMEDDKLSRSGPFPTNQEGLIVAELPPLVTTQFVTRDQGNSNPRFVRSSMYR